MLQFLSIVLLLTSYYSISQDGPESDLEYYGFRNGVAQGNTFDYNIDTSDYHNREVMIFDNEAYLIERKNYSFEEDKEYLSLHYTYDYSEDHTKCEELQYSDGKIYGKVLSDYDENGWFVARKTYKKDKRKLKLHERTVSERYKDSTVLIDYNSTGQCIKRLTICTDSLGRESGRIANGIQPKVKASSKITYNKQGVKVKTESFRWGKPDGYTIYIYQEDTKVKLDSIWGFESFDQDSTLEFRIVSGYNEMGDEIYHYSYNKYGKKIKISYYTYIYDKRGNWIRRERYNADNEFLSMTKRELTYH